MATSSPMSNDAAKTLAWKSIEALVETSSLCDSRSPWGCLARSALRVSGWVSRRRLPSRHGSKTATCSAGESEADGSAGGSVDESEVQTRLTVSAIGASRSPARSRNLRPPHAMRKSGTANAV